MAAGKPRQSEIGSLQTLATIASDSLEWPLTSREACRGLRATGANSHAPQKSSAETKDAKRATRQTSQPPILRRSSRQGERGRARPRYPPAKPAGGSPIRGCASLQRMQRTPALSMHFSLKCCRKRDSSACDNRRTCCAISALAGERCRPLRQCIRRRSRASHLDLHRVRGRNRGAVKPARQQKSSRRSLQSRKWRRGTAAAWSTRVCERRQQPTTEPSRSRVPEVPD